MLLCWTEVRCPSMLTSSISNSSLAACLISLSSKVSNTFCSSSVRFNSVKSTSDMLGEGTSVWKRANRLGRKRPENSRSGQILRNTTYYSVPNCKRKQGKCERIVQYGMLDEFVCCA